MKSKIIITILFVLIRISAHAQNVDIDLLKSINENGSQFKNDFSKTVSTSVTVVNIAAPLTILTVGLAKHDKKLQRDAAYMAGGYLLSTIITQASKRIIQRERPFNAYPFIVKRGDGGGYSMPSGHTSSAFYSATSLSILYPKWYVIAPSFLWASTVGWARMYEGVHYPSDVLVGAVVGAGSAWITYKVQRWMDKKATAKKATKPASL